MNFMITVSINAHSDIEDKINKKQYQFKPSNIRFNS